MSCSDAHLLVVEGCFANVLVRVGLDGMERLANKMHMHCSKLL